MISTFDINGVILREMFYFGVQTESCQESRSDPWLIRFYRGKILFTFHEELYFIVETPLPDKSRYFIGFFRRTKADVEPSVWLRCVHSSCMHRTVKYCILLTILNALISIAVENQLSPGLVIRLLFELHSQ